MWQDATTPPAATVPPRPGYDGRSMRTLVVLTSLVLSVAPWPVPAVAAEQQPDPGRRETLALLPHVADELMVRWGVPGMSVAVVRADEVLFLGAFGERDREAGLPVTPDTLFAVGSVTKPITALAVVMQAEAGRLSLDEPVRTWLPELRLRDAHATLHVTPRDLLAHRSGLPRHDMVWYRSPLTRSELVNALQHLELHGDLRQRFQYNNLMYAVAGRLVGVTSGGSWEEYVRTRIFEPLGMDGSGFGGAPEGAREVAVPYRRKDDGSVMRVPFYDGWAAGPALSVHSTASDLARFLRMVLGRGVVDGARIAAEETVVEVLTPQTAIPGLGLRELPITTYGLGWFVQAYRGHLLVWHSGSIDGYYAFVAALPYDDLGVVILTNRSQHRLPEVLSRWVFDRFLGLPELNWHGAMLQREEVLREAKAGVDEEIAARLDSGGEPPRPVGAYVGRYRHPAYGVLEVAVVGDSLLASYHGISGRVEHLQGDVFLFHVDDTQLSEDFVLGFLVGDTGAVTGVASPMQEGVAPIVFDRVDADPTEP